MTDDKDAPELLLGLKKQEVVGSPIFPTRPVVNKQHRAEQVAEKEAQHSKAVADEVASLEGITNEITRAYSRQLDTNTDYITREQVVEEVRAKTGSQNDEVIKHLTRKVFVSLSNGCDACSGRRYRTYLYSPDGLHQDDWLALPSVRTRFTEWSRKYPYYIDVLIEQDVNDPKPYPRTPSAEAWQRWDAVITEFIYYIATSPNTRSADEDELAHLIVSLDEPPNGGDGVTTQDVERRCPSLVDAAIKRAENEGYTILTSPVGLRMVLPKMTPRKRF